MDHSRIAPAQTAVQGREEPVPLAGRVALRLLWPMAVEGPLLKSQRMAVSQNDEWQVPAAAVIGL